MAVSVSDFVAFFPEFKRDGDTDHTARIQSCLGYATQRTPATKWGDLQDQGVLYLAAHLMAISPSGINAKLGSVKGQSTYGAQRRYLNKLVAFGRTGDDLSKDPGDNT
jgi:hypothetical protein